MSGLDDYTRFYWSVDQAGNSAVSGETENFPSFSTERYSSSYNPYVSGEVGLGYNFYSHDPLKIPTRGPSNWLLNDKISPFAPVGLDAFYFGDYTIDFYLKVSGESFQPIIESDDWSIYYENKEIHQKQGLSHHVSCVCDLSGEFKHIEFNRSENTNRIFISGELQELLNDSWNPAPVSSYSWHLGVVDIDLRDIDYVLDELRFSTGIARHTENFIPISSHYTFATVPTTIPSPVNGVIDFFIESNFEVVLQELGLTFYGSNISNINIPGNFVLTLEVFTDETSEYVYPNIQLESSLELICNFYGLTIPAIQNGEILFEPGLNIAVDFVGSSIIDSLEPGTIYDLIDNQIIIPVSLEVEVIGQIAEVSWSISFVNALELEIQFDFVNGLNFDLETSFSFKNSLTSKVSLSYSFMNKMLVVNELEKNFTFFNRILTDDPVIPNPQEYNGFYFSEIHGA
jgi:hypothetical protein